MRRGRDGRLGRGGSSSRLRLLVAWLALVVAPIALASQGARAQSVSPSTSTSTSTSASSVPAPKVAPSTDASAVAAIGPDVPDVPATIPDASAYEGKNVVTLRAKIDGVLWAKTPKLEAPAVGTKFTLAAARDQLRKLLTGGGFATGALEVAAVAGGVEVIYRLVPARFVRRVVLHGNVLSDDELLRAASLSDVRDVTERSLDQSKKAIHDYYAQRGYPDVLTEVSTIETDNPLVVIVDVRIEPGPPLTIEIAEVEGIPEWDDDARNAAAKYGVTRGDRADEDALDAADRGLVGTLRGAGFPNALVSHATTPLPGGHTVKVVVTVTSGSKVLAFFEGNVLYDREELLDILDLKDEADRSPPHLASKIEDAYVRRGYLDARVTPELLGQLGDDKRTLRFRVYEGHLVTVEKRVFPCLHGALDDDRLNQEIDSFLDEDLEGGGYGDIDPSAADHGIETRGNVAEGTRVAPDVPEPKKIYAPEVYERAVEHLRDLFRSEGYIFVEIGDAVVVRASCAKGSQPGACKVIAPPSLPDVCRTDLEQLPKESAPIPKSFTCLPDAAKGIECASTLTVVIPVNPGPRSTLWDVAFDGTKALSPSVLGSSKVSGKDLRLGEPLSLKDVETARRHILQWYRDQGYYFASVRASLEYSPDKSRARARFTVVEGEQVIIDHIFVQGQKRTLESLIRDRLLISEGGVYRENLARDSQERLAQLGVFSSVSIGLVNPTIPGKHKNVTISLVERPPHTFDGRVGYSTGEGVRGYFEYSYANLFGYAVSLTFRAKMSYQPFIGCLPSGVSASGERLYDCGATSVYDADVVRRWNNQLSGLDRYPRRLSIGLNLPHTPFLGATVTTSIEFINALDLQRDFKLDRYTPVLTFTYRPIRWLTMIFAGDLEYNSFQLFDKLQLNTFLSNPTNFARFGTLLRVPDGKTGVAATRATFTFDFRDNRLGATSGWFFSFTNEYVRNIIAPKPAQEVDFDVANASAPYGARNSVTPLTASVFNDNKPRQDFLHLTASTGFYFKIDALPKKPVLAIELAAGGNFNVFGCGGDPTSIIQAPGGRAPPKQVNDCEIYPDRLFYLGGPDTNRGFYAGQMLPQDSIDKIEGDPVSASDPTVLAAAPRGGTVFINPRIELRVPAWKWGGFVIFLDAANSWRDKKNFLRDANGNFKPWRLRYSVGPGLSIDTPIGPIALDIGFNLTRHDLFNEPQWAFNFAIGRF